MGTIRNLKSAIRKWRIRNPKSAIRNLIPFSLLLLLACPMYAQNPGVPGAVYVTSPQPRLISGQKVQLSATARDANGIPRTGDNFTWSSSNSQILSVDSNGFVTARQLGFANITAAIGNVRGVVRLQVLPLRVAVAPDGTELFIGETLQYSAVALDINETPIPQVTFQWRVSGANGFQTNAAGITPNGLLTASAIGSITIRAVISYPVNQASEFVKEYFGLARLRIKLRTDFHLTRLLSTEDVGNSFHLRPYYSEIAANDAGQVAFVGNLDGLATGLLLYDRDRLQLLASAGTPGPLPGGIVADFSAPAINNRGEVLTRSAARGSGWGLLLGSRTGSAFALVDGQTDGSIEGLGAITITRYSLNDAGDILFRANFRFTGSNTNQTGLFRLSKGFLQVLYASSFPLPGLSGTISVDNQFGIDRDGVAYFSASSGASRALYHQPEASPPTKVIAINDAFAGSTIRDFYNLVIGGGDIAFGVNLYNGSQYIVRYPRGGQSGQQSLQVQLGRVLSTSSAGVLFDGNAGRGWGLYRWQNDLVTPLLMLGRLAPNGEPVRYVETAVITAQGDVFAQARTAANEFVVMKLGGTNSVLFQAGDRVDVAAGLNFGNLVGGSSAGPIYVLAGGGRGSLFELDDRGLIPRVVLGDRLPGSASFSGTGLAKKNASGNLYFAAWEGIYRLTGEQVETIVSLPLAADDGTTIFAPFAPSQFSVNSKGVVAWLSGTNRGHTRLYLSREGRRTLLAFGGGNSAWQTPSPTGSAFDSFNELAIDDAERIMVLARLRDGASGFFIYSSGQWQTVALMNATQVGGQNVVGAFQLKALGDKFYALLNLAGGGSTLAEFRDQNWVPLASRGDITPNGNAINFISSYDVNRNGEVAFVAGLSNGGSQAVLLRSSDGLRLVYINTDATEAGDQFSNSIWEISLMDDRRVFFTGLDLNDRYLLYGAEPLLF